MRLAEAGRILLRLCKNPDPNKTFTDKDKTGTACRALHFCQVAAL